MLPVRLAVIATAVLAVGINLKFSQYGVGLHTSELTDYSRGNPFDASDHTPRRLMLSVLAPTAAAEECKVHTEPYMPSATAHEYDDLYSSFGIPNGPFESIKLPLCDRRPFPPLPYKESTIIFSPGLGNSRLTYTIMAAELASRGFTVITVDHPHDAIIVEYPDGSVARAANISTDEQISSALEARCRDTFFIIDRLHDDRARQELLGRNSFAPPGILGAGHSLGGAAAAAAMMADDRILGGINLDGASHEPFINGDIFHPFMLFGRANKTFESAPTWSEIWPHLRSTKVALSLEGSKHGTFTDFPLLAEDLSLSVEGLSDVLGSIGEHRALDVILAWTGSFFAYAAAERRSPIPNRSEGPFPEISVLALKL